MKKYFEPEAELLHFRNEQILTESWGVEEDDGSSQELSIVGGATQSSDSPASELLP